jgi:hypothetical protein
MTRSRRPLPLVQLLARVFCTAPTRYALECTIYKVLADTGWRSSILFSDLFRHPIDRFGAVPTFATQVLRRDVR